MTEHDPKRLLDPDSAAPSLLRDALEVARSDLPTAEQLVRVAAGLGGLIPGGGGGAGGGGGSPGASAASTTTAAAGATVATGSGKLILIALGTTVVVGGVAVVVSQSPGDPEPEVAPVVATAEVDQEPATETVEPSAAEPEPAAEPVEAEPPPTPARPAPRAAPPPPEPALLRQAQDALARDPRRSLTLLDTHARHYPDGLLAQEREVLAVDALLRLGRRPAAAARAAAFSERWPHAAGRRRIETLLAR